MKLTREQRNLLLTWAAEGVRLAEINDRASREDPPWSITYGQLRQARTRSRKRYQQRRDEFEQEALKEGLARRAVRLANKMARHELLRRVITERGTDETMAEVPGGRTGVLVRDYKGSDLLPVYKVDGALLKELRDLEREIAIELGQWTEKSELSGPDGGPLPISIAELVTKIYGEDEKPSTEDP